MTCPTCGSNNIYRSHARGMLEKIARVALPIHFYRCHHCDWRGMKSALKWKTISNYIASILYLLFLASIVVALVGALLFLLVFRPA